MEKQARRGNSRTEVVLEAFGATFWSCWKLRGPFWVVSPNFEKCQNASYIGVSAIFGISFGLVPALILLAGLAIYDAWAVYRTGHMVDLADSVMDLKLPILLVMPKTWNYSFLDQGSLNKQIESGEKRGALFMGLGDLVIPGALVVSSKAALGWSVGIASMVGSLAGFFILMIFVLSGRPQAGLPLLNGGAILGYLLGALIFVGDLGI